MKKTTAIAFALAALCFSAFSRSHPDGPFLEEPYLQLGDRPKESRTEALSVLWHTAPDNAKWEVQVERKPGRWSTAAAPDKHQITMPGAAPHIVYEAELTGLMPGAAFAYRVLRDRHVVFESKATARKSPLQPYRFVAFGDCGAGTPAQRAVAYHAFLEHPDFLFITGDIVYSRGRIAEYRTKFFPVYNSSTASPDTGAPLLRSVLFLAAPGNHDIANRNLTVNPDALAYFYYWMQPLNGPPASAALEGSPSAQDAFRSAAGANFPRMVNFSFDYGNSHWVVLDSNPYVDMTSAELLQWVNDDLKAAKDANWRFVAFHHPGFSSSRTHLQEQQMRLMAEIFEKNKVDIVFAGHVHNYQRTYPLTFKHVKRDSDQGHIVSGEWKLDKKYDGVSNTRSGGIIYLVSGAGGANLYNPEQQGDPSTWQEFTSRYIADTHSFTVADVNRNYLRIRQVSQDGKELDAFTVTKE